jgi:ATP-dependent Clp protease adaptor protein ClpS
LWGASSEETEEKMAEQETQEESSVAVETLPDVREEVQEGSTKPKREPNYHVIIWNDETHTYEYVIELLMKIFGHSFEKALDITRLVDKTGKGIAFTTHKELAELKRDQILAYGPDWRMSISEGSIRASIEPAPE